MKKLIVTPPGIKEFNSERLSYGEYSMKQLNTREGAIYNHLRGIPTVIVRHGSELYRQTAVFLARGLHVTGDHSLLPDEMEYNKLYREGALNDKYLWLEGEVDKLKGNEAILMIASLGIANSFPFFYLSRRGINLSSEKIGDNDVAFFDF
ncbi:MAG: hypothetical protein V1813_03385 [Candidatus Aenigmatarchaeota archaeon]